MKKEVIDNHVVLNGNTRDLMESDQRFRTLIGHLNAGVALIDESGKFIIVNPVFKQLFGLDEDIDIMNVNNTDWSKWQVFDEKGTLLPLDEHPVRKALRTGKAVKNKNVAVKLPSGGDTKWISITAEPLFKPDNTINSLIVTYYDISDIKKSEQLKDKFIGMISHELKTPLTVVIGALNMISEKGLSEVEHNELLQDAIQGTNTLEKIIENLLELSRFQAARLILVKQSVDVEQICRTVVQRLQNISKTHRFIIDLSEDLPFVPADPIRIERIFTNLIENAVKYSPRGGEVKIFARLETDDMIIGVSDQGPGISPENQSRLFQSFEQLDMEQRRAIQGVGLGLKVCRTLIEAHGGRTWVESEVGRGSTFFFSLPLREKH